MIKNDQQLGTPFVNYTDTKSAIEALAGMRAGAHAVATDNPSAPFGVYVGGAWHWYSTGSVGGASLAFQGEGVPLGTPGTVNFVGSPVSVTISGTVARVFVTGSVPDHDSLLGLQGGTGSQYYHLSYGEWGGLVTGSLTYLHKHSAVDIVTGTMATARLGSGTADGTTFLAGDQTYKTNVSAKQMLLGNAKNTTVPASSTYYIIPGSTEAPNVASFSTAITAACTISGLRFATTSAQPASGSLVITVLKTGVDTAITATIAAGAAAGEVTDLTNSVSFAAGDSLTIKVVNNATAASANIARHSILVTFT